MTRPMASLTGETIASSDRAAGNGPQRTRSVAHLSIGMSTGAVSTSMPTTTRTASSRSGAAGLPRWSRRAGSMPDSVRRARTRRGVLRQSSANSEELADLAGREVVVAHQENRLSPVGQARAERHALDVVQREPELVEVEEERLLGRRHLAELVEVVDAVDVGRAGEGDPVDPDGVARADRERPLHRQQELVVQRQQLHQPVDRELPGGNRRLGDRVCRVDVLPVHAARAQLVAQQSCVAAVGERGLRPVLDDRVLGAHEEELAVRRDCGRLEAEVEPNTAGPSGRGGERIGNRQIPRAADRTGRTHGRTAGWSAGCPPR